MSRKAVSLNCTDIEKQQLEKWANGTKVEKRLHQRARIILACLEKKTNLRVAHQLSVSRFTVAKWRTRFANKGLDGLVDKSRSGTPKKYGPAIRNKILQALETPPPAGQSTWDGKSLAVAVGASDQAVWKILQKEGIQLQRCRSWCVSTDKEFAAKSADIIQGDCMIKFLTLHMHREKQDTARRSRACKIAAYAAAG